MLLLQKKYVKLAIAWRFDERIPLKGDCIETEPQFCGEFRICFIHDSGKFCKNGMKKGGFETANILIITQRRRISQPYFANSCALLLHFCVMLKKLYKHCTKCHLAKCVSVCYSIDRKRWYRCTGNLKRNQQSDLIK